MLKLWLCVMEYVMLWLWRIFFHAMWHRRILQIIIIIIIKWKWMCNVWRMLKLLLLLRMLKFWLCVMKYVCVVSVTYIFSWWSNIDADTDTYFKYKCECKCNVWRMLKLLFRIKRNLMSVTYIYNYIQLQHWRRHILQVIIIIIKL
jgi:hypothetical protein